MWQFLLNNSLVCFLIFIVEFQEVRKEYDFFTICRTPELACRVTLQVRYVLTFNNGETNERDTIIRESATVRLN